MSIELLPGTLSISKIPIIEYIWGLLKDKVSNHYGYMGYKVFPLGNSDQEFIPSICLLTKQTGLVLIEVIDHKITNIDDEYWEHNNGTIFSPDEKLEYYADEILKRTKRDKNLYNRATKKWNFDIHTILIFNENIKTDFNEESLDELTSDHIIFSSSLEESLVNTIENLSVKDLDEIIIDSTITNLEGTTSLKKSKPKIIKLETVNDFIEKSLEQTFKQDKAQRQISLQLPNGPQRIRGLAGTGKTVVLSLKSALSHFSYKDFKILYLFNTQSLYSHIEGLITDYYVPEASSIPNWDNLQVLHAWGGRSRTGLYSKLCEEHGLSPYTFQDVRGSSDSLKIIYSHLLNKAGDSLKPIYDMVLIDEAQDFPPEVFEVVYKITKDPKRIIWAYDEFQSLKNIRIKEPNELFGINSEGKPNISNDMLKGTYEGGIKKDFFLPNCYRNPNIILVTAHAIALGMYNKDGMIDSIDTVEDWKNLGYEVLEPQGTLMLAEGDHVKIQRNIDNSKNLLEGLLHEHKKTGNKLLRYKKLDNINDQAILVANEIERLIIEQEVEPSEIVVITLDTANAKDRLGDIRNLLFKKNIRAIMPGLVEKNDNYKLKGNVTLTTPFRAKGNEANVTIVIDCQKVHGQINYQGRNAFFVALTRSRGWAHLYGVGNLMDKLIFELDSIIKNYPIVNFIRPSDENIKRRRIALTRSAEESSKTDQLLDKLGDIDRDVLLEQLKLRGIIDD